MQAHGYTRITAYPETTISLNKGAWPTNVRHPRTQRYAYTEIRVYKDAIILVSSCQSALAIVRVSLYTPIILHVEP